MTRLLGALAAGVLLLVSSADPALSARWCPPLGAALPAPSSVAKHPAVRAAVDHLVAQLNAAASGNSSSSDPAVFTFNGTVTSMSVGALSLADIKHAADGPSAYIFQHHHTAVYRNDSGAAVVNGDTVYRIASITKLVTVYALLVQQRRINLDDPVTKYVPELAAAAASDKAARKATGLFDGVAKVRWDQITVRSLACQLSGVAREFTLADGTSYVAKFVDALGLPPQGEDESGARYANPCGAQGCGRKGKN
jgi:CubicO group peptidase (beta-lactamase class C family)